MALTLKQIRQRVGKELGHIILVGTATAVGGPNLFIDDTSPDSPFDPTDVNLRLNGAGILLHNPDGSGNIFYRQNVLYTPSSQRISFGTVTGLTGTPEYEIHRETLLHPLLIWPQLVNNALNKIKRLSFPHIYLNDRGFYDLAWYQDIIGSERIRRLYWVGNNLVANPDFDPWTNGADAPQQWTASAAANEWHVPNVPNGAAISTGQNMLQVVTVGVNRRRFRGVVWAFPANTSVGTLTLTAKRSDGSNVRIVSAATPAGTTTVTYYELLVDLELPSDAATVEFKMSAANANCIFWSPMAYNVSRGVRKRVQPITVFNENGSIRMYCPPHRGVAQFGLLLPYANFSGAATVAADTTTTTAPDDLIIAAVAVEVLRWLSDQPDLPSDSKVEYNRALTTWASKFRQRAREHMRRLSKTQQAWEAGELN